MRNTLLATLILTATLALAQAAQAANDSVAVTVNGVAVPAAQAELLRQERLARGQPADTLNEQAIREMLVTMEVLAQEAMKQGVDKRPQVIAATELNRKDILGRALIDDYLKSHALKEEEMKAEYDKLKAGAGSKEYHPRHILVQTEAEAKDILAKLKKAKFDVVAKKYSKDGSAKNGGDLGWQTPGNLVPEFSNAMVKLKKGEVASAPVKSQFGWHIIKMDDVRDLKFPDYEQIKPRIAAQMQQAQIRQFLADLRAKAKVE